MRHQYETIEGLTTTTTNKFVGGVNKSQNDTGEFIGDDRVEIFGDILDLSADDNYEEHGPYRDRKYMNKYFKYKAKYLALKHKNKN